MKEIFIKLMQAGIKVSFEPPRETALYNQVIIQSELTTNSAVFKERSALPLDHHLETERVIRVLEYQFDLLNKKLVEYNEKNHNNEI